jgi:antitoxin component YwqK of YwqJK toxin-antitoxin module
MAATKKPLKEKYVKLHNDGSIWAKGTTLNGVPEGRWEWFRKDGTKLRSGYFKNGKQTGEWITYDKNGKVFKVTNMR